MPRALVSLEKIEKEKIGSTEEVSAASERNSAVGRQNKTSETFSTIVTRESIFFFGFDDRLSTSEGQPPRFRIVNTDGSHERFFSMDEGEVVGSQRIFTFREARPGQTYRGELVYGEERFKLFGPSEISRLADADDAYDALGAPPDHYHLESAAGEQSSSAQTEAADEAEGGVEIFPSEELHSENE